MDNSCLQDLLQACQSAGPHQDYSTRSFPNEENRDSQSDVHYAEQQDETLTMDKYDLEDLILRELHRMAGFQRVDDIDVGLVHFKGVIDVGRLAEQLWACMPLHPLQEKR
jgi:hypothetical protein